MELTPQLLAEVEFRDTLRGYDRDEVDTFLEQVGVAIAQLQGRLREAVARAERAESRSGSDPVDDDGVSVDTITRTLLLAQRTADGTIAEAEEEAARLVAEAGIEAARMREETAAEREAVLAATETEAREVAEQTRQRLVAEVSELESSRDEMQRLLTTLRQAVEHERARVLGVADQLRALAEAEIGARSDAHPVVLTEPSAIDEPAAPADDASGSAGVESDDDDAVQPAPVHLDPDEDDVDLVARADADDGGDVDAVDLRDDAESADDPDGGEDDDEVAPAGAVIGSIDLSDSAETTEVAAEGSEPAPGSSVFGDAGGPATQAVDVLALDDEDEDEGDDVFVRQLRDAVRPDADTDGATLSEFFDDGGTPKRLFGRRSD